MQNRSHGPEGRPDARFRSYVYAFSLVELMIVLAVMSVLGVLVNNQFDRLMVSARRAEAKSHMNHIRALHESYVSENGTYFVAGSSISLMNGSICTATSCQAANPISFVFPDCRKARYFYRIGGGAVGDPFGAYLISADEMWSNMVGAGCVTKRRVHTRSKCGELDNTMDRIFLRVGFTSHPNGFVQTLDSLDPSCLVGGAG